MATVVIALSSCLKPKTKETLSFSPSFSQIEMDAVQGSAVSVPIAANFMWTIESTAPWLNVTPNKAFGDKTLEVSVTPNTSLEVRQASFFIVGEEIRQEIKVKQKGEAPTLGLKTPTAQIGASGGEIEVEISSNVEIEIISSADWITRVTTKLVSATKYYFDVKPNTQLAAREATIKFRERGGSLEQVLSITQPGEAEDILLSKTSVEFDAEGGANGVEITANIPWKAESSKSWVKIIDTKLMEKASCLFQVEANPRVEPRTAIITISKEGSTSLLRTLDITQAGAAPSMSLSPSGYSNLPATASAQKQNIAVTANFNWILDFSATATWVSDISVEDGVCGFKVQANEEVTARSTTMLFKQVGGSLIREFVISQEAATKQVNIGAQNLIQPIPAAGGVSTILVSANISWDYSIDVPWLTRVNTKAMETEALTFTAEKNESSKARVATIRFTSELGEQTRSITQEAGAAVLTVSVNELQFSANKGEAKEFTVTSNVEWNIVTLPTWVKCTTLKVKSMRDSSFQVTVENNLQLLPREDKIIISDGANLQREILVKQEGVESLFAASISTKSVKAMGGNFSIRVEKNFATKLDVLDSWIKFKDSTSTAGVWTYNFTVDVTTQNTARSGSVRFTRVDGLGIFAETLPIAQETPYVLASDSLVLRDLYVYLAGIGWAENWEFSRPVSAFKGITLSEQVYDGVLRIVGVELPSFRLFGNLNNVHIENLKYLKVLNLSNNPTLMGVLKEDWNKMEHLETMNLGGCAFEGNIPEAWGKKTSEVGCYFPALSVLILKNNMLSGVVPNQVQIHINWEDWEPATNILPQKGSYGLLLTAPTP